jgi:hypothetical protein
MTKEMRMVKVGALAAVVAVGLLSIGCGSSGESEASEEGDVKAVGQLFYQSIADGDYDTACSQFTDAGRKQLEGIARQSREIDGSSCEEVLSLVTEASGEEQLEKQLGEIDEWQIEVDGDTATIRTSADPASPGTEMTKVDGRWRIGTQPTGSE